MHAARSTAVIAQGSSSNTRHHVRRALLRRNADLLGFNRNEIVAVTHYVTGFTRSWERREHIAEPVNHVTLSDGVLRKLVEVRDRISCRRCSHLSSIMFAAYSVRLFRQNY